MTSNIRKYGLQWPSETLDLHVEMYMIQHPESPGFVSLSHHYGRMRKAIWPELDDEENGQRWHKLCRDEIRRPGAKVTVLMGPGSSGKTHEAAWNYLCEYYCFPEETGVLVSSTDLRGLELRVWGEIKSLHERAIQRFDCIPGHLIDSKHCISTDNIDDTEARDLRKGVIAIPTIQGGKMIGLGKWVGFKQKRVRLVADEAQFMGSSFLSAFANLDKNVSFEAVVIGNPSDMLDPLGQAAAPRSGWSSYINPEKTTVWDTRFFNGRCVNLVGTDSPNFSFSGPARFPYLISREKIENTLSFFPKDSFEYASQCVGTMRIGQLARRIITRDMCVKFHAFENPVWNGDDRIKIAGLDSAFGGDRCALTEVEFGKGVDGKQMLAIYPPIIVPTSASQSMTVEDAISTYCKDYCESRGILPENFFHDSTSRGSLASSLARVWSVKCNPVEFGGRPTERPVSLDTYIVDTETKLRRLKRCDEAFDRWVSEAWWVVRLAIESDQVRTMPEDTMEEGCLREWKLAKNDKIQIETKREMKERIGRSPDLFDSLVIAVEGARRRGFQIERVGKDAPPKPSTSTWLHRAHEKHQKMMSKRVLSYV